MRARTGVNRRGMALTACLAVLTPSAARGQWLDVHVPPRPQMTAEMAEAGRAVYERNCWFCHGEQGDGNGPVARYLWPRPRDFQMASFKLRTTASGELPLDEDLYRTITRGIPGTSMPAWGTHLSERERWQVIAYLKSFAADLFEDEAFDPYQRTVEPSEPPAGSAEALAAAGRTVFEEGDCLQCHGSAGRGEGEKGVDLTDDSDDPILPANLTSAWTFKGGSSVEDVYMRLTTGLDGTPMPSYAETLTDDERWSVAYYVARLARDGDARGADVVIVARPIAGDLPTELDDPAWESAPPASVPLTGQASFAPRWQVPAVRDLSVRVLYNTEEVAVRLRWDDRFPDTLDVDRGRAALEGWSADDTYPVLYPDGSRVRGTFSDAAEIMIPVRREVGPALPHLVYGSAGRPVDLWRWDARPPAVPGAVGPVRELRAEGPRESPAAHPPDSQAAGGLGAWKDGQWTAIIRRPLSTEQGSREVQLEAGRYVPVAFHVWDGGNGEVGLRMALSSWYFVYLREPVPPRSYAMVLLSAAMAALLQLALVLWLASRARQGKLAEYGVGPLGLSE